MFYVYILYSEGSGTYYIGQTNDLGARLERHNSGMILSTKGDAPWNLVWHTDKPSRSEAVLLERKLKRLNSERKRIFMAKYPCKPFPA